MPPTDPAPDPRPEPFSVLLPVYAADRVEFVERAYASVTTDQTLAPDEVVVVRDGPVPAALQAALERLVAGSAVPARLVELPRNRGLGEALTAGLAAVRHDVVARMDADDVALPERFARQVALISAGPDGRPLDLVGSALVEIGVDEDDRIGVRRPPLTADEIGRFARFHSPFNHPTVVLRRSAVEAAGGYEHLRSFEDYWLWARMLHGGARAANIAEPLVLYRVGAGAYERRGGRELFVGEVVLQWRMHRLGFTSSRQLVRNTVVRAGYRFVPVAIRRRAYALVFRR